MLLFLLLPVFYLAGIKHCILLFSNTLLRRYYICYTKIPSGNYIVVTNHAKEVYGSNYKISNHGATIMEGEGSYEHRERKVVYSVVSGAESKKVTKAIKEVDANAFINVIKTEQLSGRFYQKPNE